MIIVENDRRATENIISITRINLQSTLMDLWDIIVYIEYRI